MAGRPPQRTINVRESMLADATKAREDSLAALMAADLYAYGALSCQNFRPTDDDSLRFVVNVPKRVQGHTKTNGSTAMSSLHLSSWIRETLVHLQIAHNFQQSTKGVYMLKSLLQDLLDQGLYNAVTVSTSITNALVGEFTQEPTRRKNVLGDAIGYENAHWSPCQSSYLQQLAGDSPGRSCREGREGRERHSLSAITHIEIYKQFADVDDRGNGPKNQTVALDSPVDTVHKVADPVKLILILELRTGAIRAKSVNKQFVTALKRKTRIVEWSHPEWPLIVTLQEGGHASREHPVWSR
ncbi:hypothetical protein M436DRAFT_67014 [Aureobasidium namibiae CBS 147.97]|uniref:Uncharacterized protein n=1 Tax=Aureobasidium namibiae CBS 147.97 TaxID=1043004 RepID=A0A074WA34_9PEZI|nr:uncharacterized protein M436DRAFT_67014 [Aureobasidium namibiae CBS 147.97]KEQ69758.1 hypothetical protein M436DRAFT_67014 [Aureobasidium namibiae CBS 147.97]